MEFSDETLVKQALSGNTDSFSLLVKKYQGAVFALAFSMTKSVEDAHDLTQESFIKAYVNLPTLREPSKFAAWLKRITWSTCAQWIRDTANRRSLLARMPQNSPKTPEDLVLEKELRDTISTALDALPEKLRLTTLLYYTDGLSYQEIASFQEVPVTTVKSRLYESRKRLKAMLSKEVIPMMKDVLKSQAPKEDFSDKIMEILANMEASAKAIRSVQFTVEDHFGGWVYYTQVAYFSPNLWRVESDNALFVCNGEKIWRYDKTWKLVDVSTVDEPDRPIIPQWWHSGIGFRMSLEKKDATFLGMGQYIPQWHFLFTRDKVDADFELKLEESQEMYLLRMTKPKRDVRDRVYFYPRQLTETPKRKLFSEEIFYSLFYGSSGLSVEMKILDMSSDW